MSIYFNKTANNKTFGMKITKTFETDVIYNIIYTTN